MKQILFFLFFMFISSLIFGQFGGGSGTAGDPYQIATAEHLDNIRNYLSNYDYYVQTADIDLGVAPWNVGEGWVPIGSHPTTFNGQYDGNGHTISNLYINRPTTNYQGLFGSIYGGNLGTVKNLNILNAEISGASYVGAITGYANTGVDLINCTASVNITGYQYEIGGLVGMTYYSSIDSCSCSGTVQSGLQDTGGITGVLYVSTLSHCSNSATVNGTSPNTGGLVGSAMDTCTISYSNNSGEIFSTSNYTGGLVGALILGCSLSNCNNSGNVTGLGLLAGGLIGNSTNNCNISYCYNIGDVSSNANTGGLIGSMYQGSINKCYNTGNVSTTTTVSGGIIGQADGIVINNCYNRGGVTSVSQSGGIAGANYGIITNCFSTGNIACPEYYGGLVGNGTGTVTGSYWDIETSGQSVSVGGTGRFTADMSFPYNVNTYVSWDWNIWKPDVDYSDNDGYPYLRSSEESTQPPEPAVCLGPANLEQSVFTSVTLNWNASFTIDNTDPPTGYRLSFGSDNPPSNICNGLDLGYEMTYDPLPDLILNTVYYWQVVPYNYLGDASDCPVWSFSTYIPDFTLTYPNGGEQWLSGTTKTIRWERTNVNPNSQLFISFDNVANWNFLTTVDGRQGFYHFQVPTLNSPVCLIKIADNPGGIHYDESNSVFSISTSSTVPKVILSYPSTSGLFMETGTLQTLSWSRQNVTNVALDYSLDGGDTWAEIVSGLNADSYPWTVPEVFSDHCRIRVRSVSNPEVSDISNNDFLISRIIITAPNSGELITGDYSGFSRYNIIWTAPEIDNVKIEYSSNNGSSWTTIIASYDASFGTFNWIVPGVPTSNGLIRISHALYSSMYDVCNAPFTIRNPIKLVTGDGGFITNNSLFNLRWQMQDISPDTNLLWEYSLTGFAFNSINLTPVPVTNESIYWYANNIESTYVWFRGLEVGTNRILVKSINPVRVTDMYLILQQPNGGEDYPAGSYQTVSWDYSGPVTLDIYLSTDGGANWSVITNGVPAADLSYSWLVSATPSNHCLIKLVDTANTYMHVQSAAEFTISIPAESTPAAPENLQINISTSDIYLTWDPVTTDIYGMPMTPDGYLVMYSENGQDYNLLTDTSNTAYVHVNASSTYNTIFYYVTSYKSYARMQKDFIRSLPGKNKKYKQKGDK